MVVSERRDRIRCSDKRLVEVTFGGEGGKPGRVLNKKTVYGMRERTGSTHTLFVRMKWRRGDVGLQVFHLYEL